MIKQVPFQPAPTLSIFQFKPAFCGNGSVSVVPFASPGPPFETVIVNPIGSPAFTNGLSAVFTMLIDGLATHVVAVDWAEPPFVVVTVPVLLTLPLFGQSPPVAVVVGELMCTV